MEFSDKIVREKILDLYRTSFVFREKRTHLFHSIYKYEWRWYHGLGLFCWARTACHKFSKLFLKKISGYPSFFSIKEELIQIEGITGM